MVPSARQSTDYPCRWTERFDLERWDARENDSSELPERCELKQIRRLLEGLGGTAISMANEP